MRHQGRQETENFNENYGDESSQQKYESSNANYDRNLKNQDYGEEN